MARPCVQRETNACEQALPPGWSMQRESDLAVVLCWGDSKRPGARHTVISPSRRMELEIRYSRFGWMWSVNYWQGTEMSGARALEKWKNFAPTPAQAAAAAARGVIQRLQDRRDSRHAKALCAAARALADAVTAKPADHPPAAPAGWPLAEHAGKPAGYYRLAHLERLEADSDVLWWTGSRWLLMRPGCEDDLNRDCTSQVEKWRGKFVAWPLELPLAPQRSKQLAAWGGAHVALPIVAPAALGLRGPVVQLSLFA